jgi:DNA-binding transcriptional MerR regulator
MAGSLGVLLLVFAVLGLGISTVSATAGTSSSGNMTALHGQGSGHHFAQNSTRQHTLQGSNITQFHSRGENVNASAAAFWKNTTAAGSWFAAHPGAKGGNQTHEKNGPGFAVNATMQQARLQSFIAELQKQGVEVSTVQTALQNNDTAAVKSWFTSYRESHKGQFGNTTHAQKSPGIAVNATMQQAHLQSFIAQLQKQGVDVSTAQTALQNNDTAAVNSWLKSYFEAHKDALANSTRQQWHPRNTTVSQSA